MRRPLAVVLVLACSELMAADALPPDKAQLLVQDAVRLLGPLLEGKPADYVHVSAAAGLVSGEHALAAAPTKMLPGEDGITLGKKGGPVGVLMCLGGLDHPDGVPLLAPGAYLIVAAPFGAEGWSLCLVNAESLVGGTFPMLVDSVVGDIDTPAAKLKWEKKVLTLELDFPTYDPDKDDLALLAAAEAAE